jgi:hypothetical protein
MSNHARTGTELDYSPSGQVAYGITVFAGALLIMISIFQILEGIAAIADDTVFVRGFNYTFKFDVTTWGWIHLIVGLIALATGIGIVMGQAWGWIMGIFVAGLSTVANFAFLPYYPFWAMTIIAIDVLIIWALCRQVAAGRD